VGRQGRGGRGRGGDGPGDQKTAKGSTEEFLEGTKGEGWENEGKRYEEKNSTGLGKRDIEGEALQTAGSGEKL